MRMKEKENACVLPWKNLLNSARQHYFERRFEENVYRYKCWVDPCRPRMWWKILRRLPPTHTCTQHTTAESTAEQTEGQHTAAQSTAHSSRDRWTARGHSRAQVALTVYSWCVDVSPLSSYSNWSLLYCRDRIYTTVLRQDSWFSGRIVTTCRQHSFGQLIINRPQSTATRWSITRSPPSFPSLFWFWFVRALLLDLWWFLIGFKAIATTNLGRLFRCQLIMEWSRSECYWLERTFSFEEDAFPFRRLSAVH